MRVFFRMWPAQQTNAVHDPTTLYRTFTSGSRHVPLLGRQGDEIATIPFFAAPRVDSTAREHDAADRCAERAHHRHDDAAAEVVAYFGCWLDINQPTTYVLPGASARHDAGDRPTGRSRGRHRCCRSSSMCAACTSA